MKKDIKTIKSLFENLSIEERYKLSEELYNEFHELTDIEDIELSEKQKELCKKIFALCPKCNCIPIAVEIQSDECYRKTDIDDIFDIQNYLDSDDEYVAPYFDDEMTKKSYDEMIECYKMLIASLGLMGGKIDGADYCEGYYVSTYVINDEYLTIEYLSDINR